MHAKGSARFVDEILTKQSHHQECVFSIIVMSSALVLKLRQCGYIVHKKTTAFTV